MKNAQSIPIVFGVTGHRDLRDEDIPLLEKIIKELFAQHQKRYPHTELVVLNALAEGADILVAKAAKELGLTLHIVLPYEKDAYLKSFADQENRELFEQLEAYGTDVMELDSVKSCNAEDCYQKLGEYIADTCNILIALWDGIDNGKKGGTSAIVRYQCDGEHENIFSTRDGNALFIINTPRVSNPNIDHPLEARYEYLGMMDKKSYEEMLKKIDKFNAKSIKYKHQEEGGDIFIERYQKYFDIRAGKYQKPSKVLMVLVLLLTLFGILSLETTHVASEIAFLEPWHSWFKMGYFLFLALAFVFYMIGIKGGKIKDNFVFYRGFAEAMRVQNAWNAASINKRVSKYFLAKAPQEFAWMRIAIKNICFLDDKKSSYESENDWIKGQTKYFVNAIEKKKERLHIWHTIETFLFASGLFLLAAAFCILVYEIAYHTHPHFPHNSKGAMVASGLVLLFTGFINKYIEIQGYKEDLYDYKKLFNMFKKAESLLQRRGVDKQKVVEDLGKMALEENSRWVVLHYERKAKVELE